MEKAQMTDSLSQRISSNEKVDQNCNPLNYTDLVTSKANDENEISVSHDIEIDTTILGHSCGNNAVDTKINPEHEQTQKNYEIVTSLNNEKLQKVASTNRTLRQNDSIIDYFSIEHCYSKPSLEAKSVKSNSDTEKLEKNEKGDTEQCETYEDKEIPIDRILEEDIFNDHFVSSMIEVVDDAQANRDVKCVQVDSSSSDDSDTSDSDSDSSDSTTSDSETSDILITPEDRELAEEVAALKQSVPPKVAGEILPSQLPPVEDLNISLPEDSILECIGRISQITPDNTAVVKSFPGKPALDTRTVLFLSKDLAIGVVDETFGPVPTPYYTVRFNDKDHLISKGIELQKEVYYAPHITDFTSFVFVSQLSKIRGSDASWINDREPPPSCIDYSDDEQERAAKRQQKKNNQVEEGTTNDQGEKKPAVRGRGRGRGRNHWHNKRTRINVTPSADETQMAWQTAVHNISGTRGVGRSRPMFNPRTMPPPPMTSSFVPGRLPPPPHYTGGPMPPPFNGPFSHPGQAPTPYFQPGMPPHMFQGPPPPPNWNGTSNEQSRQSLFNCLQHPPPPPPAQ